MDNHNTELKEVLRLCTLSAFTDNTIAHSTDEWLSIASTAMTMGHLPLFEWIINTRRAPVLSIVSPTNHFNLLHTAVKHINREAVAFLLNHPLASSLMLHRNELRQTPLKMALADGDVNVIMSFKGHLHKMYVDRNDKWGMLRKSVVKATHLEVGVYSWLCKEVRFLYIKDFEQVVLFDGAINPLELHLWLPLKEWTTEEYLALYKILLVACAKQRLEAIAILTNAGIMEKPPQPFSLYTWDDITPADAVAIGCRIGLKSVRMLADYDTDTTVVGQQSRFTWEEQLRALLSATPLSLPPVSILEIYKEVSDHRSVTKRPPKSSQWPLFLSLSSFNGAVHLPRLDLIVKYDQLDIMEWLFENNYARHDTVVPRPVMENDAFATRLEIVEEFPCRICLDFKQLPTSLPCNHSLCQLCFERVASRQPMTDHTICYFCGEDTMIPFHITLTLRLSYCIKKKHPWFMIHYRMPILHVLFGLAAGMDSINTFIWLIEYWKLDPRKVLFKDGDTVLHIAASRGSILVGEWLCNNNYSSLLEVQNDRGEIPLKQAIRSTKPGASVVVSLMIALHAARQPFIDLSVFFGDADISEPVMNVYRRIVDLENAKEPRRMFEENQDAESILCRVSFAPEYWGDQCPIEGFINLILEFRRCDVFRMMFRGPTCIIFSKMTQRKRHDLFKKVKVSGTSNMNADALTVKKLFQIEIDIKKVSKKFHSLISGNSELEAVITAYHHHRHLVAKIKTVDPNGVFAIIRHACSAPKDFLGTETKMEQSGFELAIRSDRIDVAKWLLDEVVSSERDLDDIIHPSTLFFQDQKFLCLKRSVLVVQLCKHLSVGYFSKVLHEFIVMFFHQHNSIELLFLEGHIEYLSNVPGVDINYLDENGETAVFELGRVFRSHNAGPRGESFLGIIKVLVENGLDLNIVSFKQRCTLLEVLLKEGVNEVTWPTVFWLANEKWLDVSYHYVVFSGSEENVICMRDQFNWVKIIQERSIEAAKGAVACLTFP